MKIAVDAMGGDFAPQSIIEGVNLAKKDFPDITFLLFGKEDEIKKYLEDEKNVEIIHTDEKINSDDEPVKAIRKKKNSSMVLAATAVKEGKADAIFSAGNTGALLASGLFIVGRMKGIDRPGLMTTLPAVTLEGEQTGFDMVDLGANAENEPKHLLQYAVQGSFYAENVRNVKNPRVGLLNNGTEETKGSKLTKEAFELLSNEERINFIGNVEARDLLSGVADVVVVDGFTGNAVLKSIEGTAMTLMRLMKETIKNGSLKGKIGGLLVKDDLKVMQEIFNYSNAGGAVLFGLKAPVVKTHGATDAIAVKYTIAQIHRMLESNIFGKLEKFYQEQE